MNVVRKLFVFFLIFFFIFAPRLDFNVVIHTGFLSVLLLAALVAVRQRTLMFLPKPLVVVAVFFLILAFYHLAIAVFYGNEPIYFFSICISVVVSVVFGWMLASYLFTHGANSNDLIDQLMVVCATTTIVNSSVILVEYILPEFKFAIESVLLQMQDGNINYAEHPFRLRGLASAGGAGLSVANAIAIVFLIYLVINRKLVGSFALLGAVVVTCSNVFTGRTGLILSLSFTFALLVIVLAQNFKSGLYGIVRAASLVIFFSYLLSFLVNFDLDPEVARWAFEWFDGLIAGKLESGSTEDLERMLYLPDDPVHLLFGIGFFEGVGNIYPRTDSGYLKTILSIGFPLGILLYYVIIFMFFRVNKVSSKYFWLVVTVSGVMLLIEVKEPFLYQNFAARMIFLLSGAAMFILAKRRALAKAIRMNADHIA